MTPDAEPLSESFQARLPDLMREAIAEARLADRPFGCVIVNRDSGEVLIRQRNRTNTDPFGHAEILAIRRLLAEQVDPARCVLVSTAEPCPMCAWACFRAGVWAVAFGTPIKRLIACGFGQIEIGVKDLLDRAAPISPIRVFEGVLREETDSLYSR